MRIPQQYPFLYDKMRGVVRKGSRVEGTLQIVPRLRDYGSSYAQHYAMAFVRASGKRTWVPGAEADTTKGAFVMGGKLLRKLRKRGYTVGVDLPKNPAYVPPSPVAAQYRKSWQAVFKSQMDNYRHRPVSQYARLRVDELHPSMEDGFLGGGSFSWETPERERRTWQYTDSQTKADIRRRYRAFVKQENFRLSVLGRHRPGRESLSYRVTPLPTPRMLYHVSAHIPSIRRSSALFATSEAFAGGLGGAKHTVSFTDNPRIALRIREEQRRLIAMAHAKNPVQFKKLLRYAIRKDAPLMTTDEMRQDFQKAVRTTLKNFERNRKYWRKNDLGVAGSMLTEAEHDAADAYRSYLQNRPTVAEKNLFDPYFISTKGMSKLHQHDVGIVAIPGWRAPRNVLIAREGDTQNAEIRVYGDVPLTPSAHPHFLFGSNRPAYGWRRGKRGAIYRVTASGRRVYLGKHR